MSRSVIAGLMAIALLGATAPAALADDGLSPPDYTIESVVLDPGAEPRVDLVYDWSVGQTETMIMEMWEASANLLDGYPLEEQPGVPIRVEVTATVESIAPDRSVLLETVVTDVDLLDAQLVDDADALREALASLVGLRIRERLDDKGYLLASETIDPQPALTDSHPVRDQVVGNLEHAATRLPLEPIGPGGVWQEVTERTDNNMGVTEIATITKTLTHMEGERVAALSVESAISVPLQTTDAFEGPFADGVTVSMEGAANVTLRIDLDDIAQTGSGRREFRVAMVAGSDDAIIAMDVLGQSGIAFMPQDRDDPNWPTLPPVGIIELPEPEPEDGAATESVAEVPGATIDVVLLDPGVEPRQELRYAWHEGQVEHHVLVMRMGMRQVIEGEWTPWLALPANEIAANTTVTAAHDDGTYEVEVIFTDVSIPQGSATLPPEALTEIEDQMSSMIGMTQALLIDDRGRILSAETSLPPGADLGSLQPGQLDAATKDFIDPLPAEPVGEGAVWEVAKQSSDGMGFVTNGANTYTLEDIDSTGLLHLEGEMAMTADPQPMSVPGVPPSVDATLDRFDIEGGLAKTVDLGLVNPSEASSRAVAEYVFSIAFGDTAETTEMEVSMEMDARVIDSALAGPAGE